MQVRTFLLCRWLSLSGGAVTIPGVPTNPDIASDFVGGGIQVSWTNPNPVGTTNEIWKSTDGITFVLFSSVAGGVSQIIDATAIVAGNIWYYKVRSCNGASCSAFTSIVSVSFNYTSPNVAAISFPTLIRAIGFFQADGLAALTTISLPALKTVSGNLDLANNPNLTSLNLTALSQVFLAFFLGSNKLTGAVSFPSLISVVSDFQIQNNVLITSLSAPVLTSVGGNFTPSGLTALTSVNLNALHDVGVVQANGRLDFNADTALPSVSFPLLQAIGDYLLLDNCTSITSVSFPAMTAINASGGVFGISASNCTLLASFSVPQVIIPDNGLVIAVDACALNAASVNQILERCVASGFTGPSDIELAGGTNAAPSGQGVIDKATLIVNGCTVNTN